MRKIVVFLWMALMLAACDSNNCSLQNTVQTVYLMNDTLKDTLTVSTRRADGTLDTLINRGINLTTLTLPISYNHPEDTFLFCSVRLDAVDTVWVAKEDYPYFESVECNASFFHKLTAVRSTHVGIDTIVILNSNVDYYATIPHFLIYFTPRD